MAGYRIPDLPVTSPSSVAPDDVLVVYDRSEDKTKGLPAGNSLPGIMAPVGPVGYVLSSTGVGVTWSPLAGAELTAQRKEIVAAAGQVNFLPDHEYIVGYMAVYRNGYRLASTEYTANDGINVVLTTPSTAGDVVILDGFIGSLVISGVTPVASGGTGQTSYDDGELLIGRTLGHTLVKSTLTAGPGVTIVNGTGSITISAPGALAGGTVTSVGVSGGTTGLSITGSPITTNGTMVLGGVLNASSGGTGATTLTGYVKGNGTGAMTASATIPVADVTGAVPPAQAGVPTGGTAGQILSKIDATNYNTQWIAAPAAGGSGTVTSVAMTVPTGLTVTGSPITSGGTLAVTYAAGYQGYTTAEATKLAGIAAGADTGTVTSAAMTVPTGLSVTGTPITTSGTFALTYTAGYQGYTTTEATKLAGIASGATANVGTVTSVGLSGGTTGLTVTGSPITTNGTFTLAGTLVVANGGTGASTLTGYLKGNGTAAVTASATIPVADVVGAVPEAPIDSQQYGRKDAAWTVIDSFGAAVADWNWNASTTSNPASGTIRANNASQPSATVIYIDGTTITGSDIANYLKMAVKVGQLLYIQDKSNAANWNAWTITSLPTYDVGNTYFSVPVAWSQGGSSIPAGRVSVTLIDPTGGTGSGDVVGPASAVADNLASFNGVTGKIIKDSGKAAPSGVILGTTDTQTVTNKRINPRVPTTASSATPTINSDITDVFGITALAVDITSFTTNLSGTPVDGQMLVIYIVGTASRAIAWGASFESSTVTLPTTTVGTARIDVGLVWNAATSKWRCLAVA